MSAFDVSAGPAADAIAFPYPVFPGNPGVAADHTIVVTGSGQATMANDGSDRATAVRAALDAALADAKAQADEVARITGASISGVLSVSVSTSQTFGGPVPLGGAPASGKPSTGAVPPYPDSTQLIVSVTVAYRMA